MSHSRNFSPDEFVPRRQVLKWGAALGAFSAFPAAGVCRSAPGAVAERAEESEKGSSKYGERVPGHRFQLSCAGYSFRQLLPNGGKSPTMTLETFIDFCARQELDGVELTSYYFTQTDPAYLHSLKRRALLNGLAITGT